MNYTSNNALIIGYGQHTPRFIRQNNNWWYPWTPFYGNYYPDRYGPWGWFRPEYGIPFPRFTGTYELTV